MNISPEIRLANAKATLALQNFAEQPDGTFQGEHYKAEITDRHTIEPESWRAMGAKPSYIIRYYR